MYLETSDRRSLIQNRAHRRISSSLRRGSQGLRRLRFSFFLFTCQTAREPWRSPPFRNRKARSPFPSENCRMLVHRYSEELQERAIAAKRGGRRRWVVYRGEALRLSTPKIADLLRRAIIISVPRFPLKTGSFSNQRRTQAIFRGRPTRAHTRGDFQFRGRLTAVFPPVNQRRRHRH